MRRQKYKIANVKIFISWIAMHATPSVSSLMFYHPSTSKTVRKIRYLPYNWNTHAILRGYPRFGPLSIVCLFIHLKWIYVTSRAILKFLMWHMISDFMDVLITFRLYEHYAIYHFISSCILRVNCGNCEINIKNVSEFVTRLRLGILCQLLE